ncbi:hypothetical protein ACLI4A_17835, partial [Pseudomonas aeruginosa]
MGSLDRQRWDALWQRLGGNPPADAFDALLAAYGGADRHYHSDRHILACLEHFDRWRQLALRPDLVELAFWPHDLVYHTPRQDNELSLIHLSEPPRPSLNSYAFFCLKKNKHHKKQTTYHSSI